MTPINSSFNDPLDNSSNLPLRSSGDLSVKNDPTPFKTDLLSSDLSSSSPPPDFEIETIQETDFPEQIERLKDSPEQVQEMIKLAQESSNELESAFHLIEGDKEEIFDLFMERYQAFEDWGDLSGKVFGLSKGTIGTSKYVGTPLRLLAQLKVIKPTLEGFFKKVQKAESVLQVAEFLNRFGSWIFKGYILKILEDQIKIQRSSSIKESSYNERLNGLEKWVKEQKQVLAKQKALVVTGAVSISPLVIQSSVELFTKVGDKFLLGNYILGAGIGIGFKSLGVHTARVDRGIHSEWLEKHLEKPFTLDEKGYNKVNDLLKKRKQESENRKEILGKEFDDWIAIISNKNSTLTGIEIDLKEKCIFLERLQSMPQIKTKEQFLEVLKNPEIKNEMQSLYVVYKETMAVTIRQHLVGRLKTMVSKKHQIERKFLNFNLAQQSISLAGSVIATTITIILKSLVLAAVIAVPTFALALTGVGVFVLGVALILVGSYVLYRYKPNLFMQMIQCVQLRLTLTGVPHAIQQFRLNYNVGIKLKNELEFANVSSQLEQAKSFLNSNSDALSVPVHLRPLFEKHKKNLEKQQFHAKPLVAQLEFIEKKELERLQKQKEVLDQKISSLEKSVKEWESAMEPLQKKIKEAAWADFKYAMEIKEEDDEKGLGLEIEDSLVESFVEHQYYMDDSTKDFFKMQLGMDLTEAWKDSSGKRKEALKKGFQEFFAMDEGALVRFIKKQNEEEKRNAGNELSKIN